MRYNYTQEELYALVDVISMVKGCVVCRARSIRAGHARACRLAALMTKTETLFMPLVRTQIHDEMQTFLQKDVCAAGAVYIHTYVCCLLYMYMYTYMYCVRLLSWAVRVCARPVHVCIVEYGLLCVTVRVCTAFL